MFGAQEARTRAQLYRSLSSLANAGLSLGEALTVAGRDMGQSRLAEAVRQMGHEVSGGREFADAMRRRPTLFSALETSTVEVGGRTGRYESVLGNLADFYEREHLLRLLLLRELTYPIVLFCAILFIPLAGDFIRIWITQALPGALAATAQRLLLYGVVIGVPALFAALVIRGMRGSAKGRAQLDAMKLQLPLLGGVFLKFALARFCRALAALYSSGVLMGTSMRLAGEAAGNEVVRRDLTAYASEVDDGASLAEAFAKSQLMPASVLQVLQTGELTGDLDAMAQSAAAHLELEAETSVKQLAVSITPLAILVAAVVVGLMLASFYTGLYSF